MTTLANVTLTQVPVLDSSMAYREAGSPDLPTVLFLHGNPTSSVHLAEYHAAGCTGRTLHRS